jgi:hypothetical protein
MLAFEYREAGRCRRCGNRTPRRAVFRSVRTRATGLFVGAVLAGCAADAGGPPDVSRREAVAAVPRGEVVVTRDDRSLPPACRPRDLALRIGDFLDAISRGDPASARFMAASGGWYSVTEGRARHFVAYDRAKLAGYFARRHEHGERMRLLELAVGFANGLGQIEFRVERRADDLRRLGVVGRVAHGKGAVNCSTRQVVVWSMGMATRRQPDFVVCPRRRAAREDAVVACARRWR